MPRFTSRVDGFKSRKPHWVCKQCGVAFTTTKPRICTHCGEVGRYNYFPSKKEYNRYQELLLLERSGHVDEGTIELQPKYILHIADKKFNMTADFRYKVHGREVVEDVKTKGTDTDLSKIKRALAEAEYGIEVILV